MDRPFAVPDNVGGRLLREIVENFVADLVLGKQPWRKRLSQRSSLTLKNFIEAQHRGDIAQVGKPHGAPSHIGETPLAVDIHLSADMAGASAIQACVIELAGFNRQT